MILMIKHKSSYKPKLRNYFVCNSWNLWLKKQSIINNYTLHLKLLNTSKYFDNYKIWWQSIDEFQKKEDRNTNLSCITYVMWGWYSCQHPSQKSGRPRGADVPPDPSLRKAHQGELMEDHPPVPHLYSASSCFHHWNNIITLKLAR